MKHTHIAVLTAVAGLMVVTGCLVSGCNSSNSEAVAGSLGVDQLAKDPSAFANQTLIVQGVVSAVIPDERLFTIIDQAEYEACKVATCAQYQIPITFAHELPKAQQSVRVTGQLIEAAPGRFLLEASAVDTLP